MSEYQYYEFLAIDRLLKQSEMDALRALSTRAEITPTRFANVYNWGSFRGSPAKMMEKYFDAHVYVANWGTRIVMLRLPKDSVDEEALRPYVVDDVMDYWTTDEHLIVRWERNEEPDDDWIEGKGWMVRLIPIREELERGDYRALYMGWLYGVNRDYAMDDLDYVAEDDTEPPVPAGLRSLTPAQRALAEFMGLDNDLLVAAASASLPAPDRAETTPEIEQWIADIPGDEARKYLLLLLQSKGRQAEAQIRHQYAAYQRSRASSGETVSASRRSVEELEQLAERSREERLQREERKRQEKLAEQRRQREQYLVALAEDYERHWKQVCQLTEQRLAATYEQARDLLVDLRDAYTLQEQASEFQRRLGEFRTMYARRSALIRRLDEVGLS
jgi:hypothetical protein